jgi:hypothetical protein
VLPQPGIRLVACRWLGRSGPRHQVITRARRVQGRTSLYPACSGEAQRAAMTKASIERFERLVLEH